MSAIASLAEDRVVEGVYAVARKERRRTRGGAPYLALELVDPSGRIEARVWSDVELLEGRFGEGDAVRVLGRVERFRDRLQVDVRSLEAAAEADPAEFAPALRRDAAELDGFLEFLAGELAHPGLRAVVDRFVSDGQLRAAMRGLPAADTHHAYAGGLLEHTVGVAVLCREAAQLHPRLRADLVLAAALLHDVGRTRELERGPTFRQTDEGRLLGHVHLGLRLIEERAGALEAGARAELLHAVAVHHELRGARTAEASVLSTRTSSTPSRPPALSSSGSSGSGSHARAVEGSAHIRHDPVTHLRPELRYPQTRGQGPKGPGGKASRTRVNLVRELGDPALDLVAQRPHLLDRRIRRIGQVPVQVALPRKHRARVAATHRHDELGPLDIAPRKPAWAPPAKVDANLTHRLDHLRMNGLGGRRAGGSPVAAEPLVEGLCHLRPARVLDADE